MTAVLGILLRALLVAAFVPVLAVALLQPTPVLLVVLVPLALAAWASLRLGASRRWRGAGLLLALAACGGVWSLAVAASHGGAADLIVP